MQWRGSQIAARERIARYGPTGRSRDREVAVGPPPCSGADRKSLPRSGVHDMTRPIGAATVRERWAPPPCCGADRRSLFRIAAVAKSQAALLAAGPAGKPVRRQDCLPHSRLACRALESLWTT